MGDESRRTATNVSLWVYLTVKANQLARKFSITVGRIINYWALPKPWKG